MNTRTHGQLATFIICNPHGGPYKRNEYRKVILPLAVLRRFDSVLAGTFAGARHSIWQSLPSSTRDSVRACCTRQSTHRG